MRTFMIIALSIVAVYWLSGRGIVNFDSSKAKSCIEEVQNKLKNLDSGNLTAGGTRSDMTTVNYEVNKLCDELRELSEKALTLRQKLLANVVDSTNPERKAKARSSRYSRR